MIQNQNYNFKVYKVDVDFMLSNNDADMIAGKIPQTQNTSTGSGFDKAPPAIDPSGGLPAPVQQQTKGTSAFWTVEYWKHYFRIETNDVLLRILATLIPTKDFNETIGDNPDFYGPFWIPTTVIFCLFAASTVAESIAKAWSQKVYTYDMTLLSFAAITVYAFMIAIPALFYGYSKYHHAAQVKLFHLINIYGYGMFIWAPVAVNDVDLALMYHSK